MATVYVSIGSNIERERHIAVALEALGARFADLLLSPVYESEAVGFSGDNFFNLAARFTTALTVGELARALRELEFAHGRRTDTPKFAPRTLDIDILTYDDLVGVVDGVVLPRPEIVENAFVLLPLQDIAGEVRHPVLDKPYRQLWQEYDQRRQSLWRVDLVAAHRQA